MNQTSAPFPALAPALRASAGSSSLGINTDPSAVESWLKTYGQRLEHTMRTYRRIASRLLLWLDQQGTALGEMTSAQDHLEALRNPDPRWLIPRTAGGKLAHPLYRSQSLKRPISDKGIAWTVLVQLFHYLLTAGYMRRNVFVLTEIAPVIHADVADKVLSQVGRRYLWDWLTQRQEHAIGPLLPRLETARDRWVFALLYATGIRTKKAIGGRTSDFVRDSDGWQLRGVSKGAKVRRVTVTNSLVRELRRFREMTGMSPWPTSDEDIALIPHVRTLAMCCRSISDRMLRKIVDAMCLGAARDCDDPFMVAELERLSPRWFRHTSATHRQEAGARLETTQQELGHSNLKTTLVYGRIAGRARCEDAERFETAAAAPSVPEKLS